MFVIPEFAEVRQKNETVFHSINLCRPPRHYHHMITVSWIPTKLHSLQFSDTMAFPTSSKWHISAAIAAGSAPAGMRRLSPPPLPAPSTGGSVVLVTPPLTAGGGRSDGQTDGSRADGRPADWLGRAAPGQPGCGGRLFESLENLATLSLIRPQRNSWKEVGGSDFGDQRDASTVEEVR